MIAKMNTNLQLLEANDWKDYALMDSGNGARLERFGAYIFIRPDHQASWKPNLDESSWREAHAVFKAGREESGGQWEKSKAIVPAWQMGYKGLKFMAKLTNSRQLGVFPEQASHWDWIAEQVLKARRILSTQINVLNLFGYTGLASLAAAKAGAHVTHVDASKKSVAWARENQETSRLADRPVRWIVDDALKFVQRENRRDTKVHGIIMDPPKFGRGPKGEVWECLQMLPTLLQACRSILKDDPRFVVITAYAIRASALSLYYPLEEMMAGIPGKITVGELVLREESAGRLLSTAIFGRWEAE
jgi:23S rRNA (cytosine1962-C5)-methyltransferase